MLPFCIAVACFSTRVAVMPATAAKPAVMSATAARPAGPLPFAAEEVDSVVNGLKALAGPEVAASLDWEALRALYAESAHKSHKDWPTTEAAADTLAKIIGAPDCGPFSKIFSRVLSDGNFGAAQEAAAARPSDRRPWIVLVTGVNGIRKTTSVHQPWFKACLAQALAGQFDGPCDALPDGGDSFFRQLDYMIATLAVESFRALYEQDEVAPYAEEKAAIFGRMRTPAEQLGILLVKDAQRKGMNVMVETSGRDIGMFEYIDHLFPDGATEYRKMVVHFSINELGFAERSVDARMLREMGDGRAAIAALATQAADTSSGVKRKAAADAAEAAGAAEAMAGVVKANAGGPYGSAVLRGVQADSEAVWSKVSRGGAGEVGGSWLKACIAIEARELEEGGWTARAMPADPAAAASAEAYAFGPPPRPPQGSS